MTLSVKELKRNTMIDEDDKYLITFVFTKFHTITIIISVYHFLYLSIKQKILYIQGSKDAVHYK